MRKGLIAMLGGLLMSVFLAVTATAQQAEIEGTITSQLEAFKVDDFEQAFTYATPTLQRLFKTPQNFERMVTQGYPMVWRPAEVTYLELAEQRGALIQKVQIVDAKGFKHLLAYRMIKTDAGWRIGGVQILDSESVTA
ncbi:DUF4864 domain-containing protein [uncultured Sulfitobacter sp.]|uniref:DUF4864 domain-containing protein n=1 Tax=uncultured Sulfitobacter sp. TaxID=191468 RepID=UPI0026399800|nr:DUF4864 domain-containing protein [uncultured Sulfitobacter sp.]